MLVISATALLCAAGCREASTAGSSAGGAAEREAADTTPWFEEVAAASGIDFFYESGHSPEGRHWMPEIMGGGAALFDMNNNGLLDLYLVQGGPLLAERSERPPNQLYRNEGEGYFSDITDASGAGDRGYGMGAACGDFTNDGFIDIYVTNFGRNTLLRNRGDETFEDVTNRARVGDRGWGCSAAWLDYNHDGHLDLFVTNYLNWSQATELNCFNDHGAPDYCSPQNYNAPAADVLFHNNGDGTFTDVSDSTGIAAAPGTGLGVAAGDFNQSGWIDIFVANDGMNDHLWINQGPAGVDGGGDPIRNATRMGTPFTFRERAMHAGCAVDDHGVPKAGMGVTVADINDNGHLDLLVCNLNRETDSLFVNDGGVFMDRTAASGLAAVSRPFTRFGMAWLDFDNDGVLDLYQANGRVMRQSPQFGEDAYAEPNVLLRGVRADARGVPAFRAVTPRGGVAGELIGTSRAAAFGDLDNNGGIDIVVVNRDGPAHLLRNIAPRGNWLMLRVLDERGRDAIGATVSLSLGERRITRDVRTGYSYLASNDPRVHFGLGDATEVRDLTVKWIDGTVESFGDITGEDAVNRVVTIQRSIR